MTCAADHKEFRSALGRFTTGVTVVTACDASGRRVGLTANSFSSVSLDPPLILWSLSRSAPSLPAFEACAHYAVNVLAADQVELSRRFARSGRDKFAGLACEEGLGGAPLLPGCVARFECRNAQRYAGGDHVIFLGQVERLAHCDREPLVFFAGRYGVAAEHPSIPA